MLKKLLLICLILFITFSLVANNKEVKKLEKKIKTADDQIKVLKKIIENKEFKDQRSTEVKLDIELLNKDILQLKIKTLKLTDEVSSLNNEIAKFTSAPEDNFKKNKTIFDDEMSTRKFTLDDSHNARIKLEKLEGEHKDISSRIKSTSLDIENIEKFVSTLKEKKIANITEISTFNTKFENENDVKKAASYKSISSFLESWNKKALVYETTTVDYIQLSKLLTTLLEKKSQWQKFEIMFQKYKYEQIKGNEVLTKTQVKEKNELAKQRAFFAGKQETQKSEELLELAEITRKEIESMKKSTAIFPKTLSKKEIEELGKLNSDLIKMKEQLLSIREKSSALYENTAKIKVLVVEVEKENVNIKDNLSKKKIDKKEIRRLHEKFLQEETIYTEQSESRSKEADEAYQRIEASNLSFNSISESLLIAKQKQKKEPNSIFLIEKIKYLERLLKTGKKLNNITEIFFLCHYLNKIHAEKLSRMYQTISDTLSPPPNFLEKFWKSTKLYIQTSVWPAFMKVLIPLFTIIVIFFFCWIINFIVGKIFDVTGFVTKKLTLMHVQTQSIDTFRNLLKSAIKYAIYGVGIVISLKQIGVNPNLSVGGIGVVALITTTFGKTVFENFLSGLFLILENRYSVGDFIEAAGVSGFVDDVSLRTTTIRMVNGEVHIIPNGNIKALKRFPGGDQEARVDIFIKKEDSEKAVKIVDELSKRLEKEMEYILRVPRRAKLKHADSEEFFIRYIVTTLPKEDWVVNNEFVKRAKLLLAENEIPITNDMVRVTFLTNVEMFKSKLKLLKEKVRILNSKKVEEEK